MSNIVKTVKDLDHDRQPRERALRHGIQVLSTAELWAIILRVGTASNNILDMCDNLMDAANRSLVMLERMSREQLLEIDGIGDLKMLQIEAVVELARRYYAELNGVKNKYVINSSKSIYEYMISSTQVNCNDERIWVIFLNQGNRVISFRCISEGGAKGAVFDLKGVLRQALAMRAESIVLVHNHPSGNLNPSGPDDNITRMLQAGAKQIDLRLLDHVIISDEGFYSYHDQGRL